MGRSKPATPLVNIYKAKLAISDITMNDAKRLGFEVAENAQKLEGHFFQVPCFKIPYYNAKGKPTGFYRIRYLKGTKKGFARATTAKDRRYDQPAAECPQLYMPRILPGRAQWDEVLDDPRIPLVFTEGELKAAAATKNGVPCLALGGVWNFKSKKNGLFRLPVFDEIKLKDRTVFIIFDSDAATNPQVLFAQYKFAEELFHAGAVPLIINIPKEEGKKHGIDDYIVEYGIKKFKTLISDENTHVEFTFIRELMRMNTEIAMVQKPVAVMHFETGQLLKRGDAAMLYANARMMEQRIKPGKGDEDDDIKYVEVPAFEAWLKWEQRMDVWAPVYEPGRDKFVDLEGRRHFNTWRGWACKPEKGDVKLWKWLLDQVFKNALPEHRVWFEQWCAYPIQNPGVKMFTCPILFGQLKGTGKSLLGLTLGSIYGENFAEITDTQLEDERNVFAAEKQFVLANEVTGSDKRSMVGRLRNLITQHSVTINRKWQPDYSVRDTINYFFTSNHIDAVYMEDDERRFFVHEVLGPRLVDVDERKVQEYDAWLRSGEAAKAVFYYLLNVDLDDFDPTAPAPDTPSKTTMVEASRTEIESWAHRLKEDADTCLRSGNTIIPFRLFTIKELLDLYQPEGRKPYEKTMTNALRRAGFVKAGGNNSCRTKSGKLNLWVVRDFDHTGFSAKDFGLYYDKERETLGKKKFEKGSKK